MAQQLARIVFITLSVLMVLYMIFVSKEIASLSADPHRSAGQPGTHSIPNALDWKLSHHQQRQQKLHGRIKNENDGAMASRLERLDQLNRTKIAGFISGNYKDVGIRWYKRLERLGYSEHRIVLLDDEAHQFFNNESLPIEPNSKRGTEYLTYRTETSVVPPFPKEFWGLKPYASKLKKRVKMYFAHRWKYTLEQLQAGYHVLITDVDNIWSRHYPMSAMELSDFDVFHALETKYPEGVYEKQGFTFCGGMGWFRSDPKVIKLVQTVVETCGILCDDQIELNNIIADKADMEWNLTDQAKSHRTVDKEMPRLDGLLINSFNGVSRRFGYKSFVWDRNLAYRGANDPKTCPNNNWVSMPFVEYRTRTEAASAKARSYQIWDEACPSDYSFRFRSD